MNAGAAPKPVAVEASPTPAGRWLRCFYPCEWVVLIGLVGTYALAYVYDFPVDLRPAFSSACLAVYLWTALIFVPLFLSADIIEMDLCERRENQRNVSLFVLLRRIRERYTLRAAVPETLRFVFAIHFIVVLHSNLKQRIPTINPALNDAALAHLDRLFCFGADPVALLAHSGLMSRPWAGAFIDWTYILWYFLKLPMVAYFLLTSRRVLAQRFTLAWCLMWGVHIVFVLLWPSLGPCYATPQFFTHLSLPLAKQLQAYLWGHYQLFLDAPEHYQVLMYTGVAAFPSMHVGLIALYALFFSVHRKGIGWACWAYTLVILIGSCVTGWHYLVDGLFAIVMAVGVFVAARWLEPRWRRWCGPLAPPPGPEAPSVGEDHASGSASSSSR